jgi:hypothetical protein
MVKLLLVQERVKIPIARMLLSTGREMPGEDGEATHQATLLSEAPRISLAGQPHSWSYKKEAAFEYRKGQYVKVR